LKLLCRTAEQQPIQQRAKESAAPADSAGSKRLCFDWHNFG
jgi:hypothetical protein